MMKDILSFLLANWSIVLGAMGAVMLALVALLHALVALFLLIPGAQPEAFFQACSDKLEGIANWLSKYSAKPAAASDDSAKK